MLQRIQTIYLLIITILMVSVIFMPLAMIQSGHLFYLLDVYGISALDTQSEYVYPNWGLLGVTVIVAILSFVTIFLYKKRVLQIRICVFNAILLVLFYGLFALMAWSANVDLGGVSFSYMIALSFPAVCIILDYLAIRNIGADETLVRSLDRLR